MIRSILAVVAGYAIMVVGVGVATALAVKFMLGGFGDDVTPTSGYLAVNLAYSGLFAALGGYITAVIANRAPMKHVWALAAVMLLMSVVSFVMLAGQDQGQQPDWYPYTISLIGIACVVSGGKIRVKSAKS